MTTWLLTIAFLAAQPPAPAAATCVGADPCKACRSCKSCKHCATDGGTCGVKRKAEPGAELLRDVR